MTPPAERAAVMVAVRRAARAARIEDYMELRSWGVPVAAAAARVGVSVRTAWRYEAIAGKVAA